MKLTLCEQLTQFVRMMQGSLFPALEDFGAFQKRPTPALEKLTIPLASR